MANLPLRLPIEQMQVKWSSQLNPVISNPVINGLQLTNIKLTTGNNSVNHLLGRDLQGWIIVGINGISDIYDTQATNQLPKLTLNLVSSADVIVSLWVY